MRFSRRLNIYARPRRPTLDGPAHSVHLHNLYAGGQRTTYISIFFTPGKNIRHIKRPKATLKAKCCSGGRFCFENRRLGKEYGDAQRAPARLRWAGADGRKYLAADQISRGVQGSSGPLVGGRRIETAGPLVLSVMKEQR